MHKRPPCSCTERRRGQAAIETTLSMFGIVVLIMGTWHLFQVTWAAQNANIRAREAVLHGTSNMTGKKLQFSEASSPVWDTSANNYKLASYGETIDFTATATDRTNNGFFSGQDITATARITETE